MVLTPGALVISLDFELRWGLRDIVGWERYTPNLLGARAAVPAMLRLFEQWGVHATWAAVGFLFARDKDELLAHLPSELPTYDDSALSPYPDLASIGADEATDPLSYAPSLLDRIAQCPGQEIGTHTFSHYYCLEPGQTEGQFRADLRAAAEMGARYGSVCRSLVLPRNQHNPAYDGALAESGVIALRLSGDHWAYRPTSSRQESPTRRAARLLDSYLPVTKTAVDSRSVDEFASPVRLRASAFLRPVPKRVSVFEPLRFWRIERDLVAAAQTGGIYHLWWHPHNFGVRLGENLAFLDSLLTRFSRLRRELGMQSLNMGELVGLGKAHPQSSLRMRRPRTSAREESGAQASGLVCDGHCRGRTP